MRRVATTLALAVCLLGCGSPGERVELAITEVPVAEGVCYTVSWILHLVADPRYGTAYTDLPGDTEGHPLYWPTGYTGWRVGSEVEVRDLTGKLVAVTGRRYKISLGSTPQGAPTPGLVTSAACISEQ